MGTSLFKDLECEKIRVGQEVIITVLDEGEYLGKIHFINPARNRVELEEVVFRRTNAKLAGIKKFYKPEIKSIEIVSKVDAVEEKEEENVSADTRKKFEIGYKEFKEIKNLIANTVIIDNIGKEYDFALNEILKQDFVGLDAEGLEDGKNSHMTSIVIGTPFKMYVFNIKAIGGIEDGLKEILKSEVPVKVLHDASQLRDNLLHCHGVNLKGIFDTMVSLKFLGYSKTDMTLRECMTEHMVLPSEFVEEIKNSTNAQMACIYTSILIKLHDFITEQLLANAYKSFNDHVNLIRNTNSDEAQLFYRNERAIVKRLEAIPPYKIYQLNSVEDVE